jgi:hypothetical protein
MIVKLVFCFKVLMFTLVEILLLSLKNQQKQ